MRAMILDGIYDLKEETSPLQLLEIAVPEITDDEILIQVLACGICHTELDEIEGRTPPPQYPVIPGHQVVGEVIKTGAEIDNFLPGDIVGVAWIYSACGKCEWCLGGQENLCPEFRATGRDANGGYAEYMAARADYAVKIPDFYTAVQAAPLLCAGAVGYRSLKLADVSDGDFLGFTGFGASAHLVLKTAQYLYPKSHFQVFARNPAEREFAMSLGAEWAGDTSDKSPTQCHAIIDTTPVWKPVVEALANLRPGGRLVINAIRKESHDQNQLMRIKYEEHLWQEKEIKSVANVTSSDIREFIGIAVKMKLIPAITEYPLEKANEALLELKAGNIRGAKVISFK
ncbi:MAG: zinc-dependent alcohol dehydrogenase family protein [Candidatus Stygibacter frigidus]|nr:zinc-dependent alcohol dehydrogenase family protein [Candidatus Stygibacter frigidus]